MSTVHDDGAREPTRAWQNPPEPTGGENGPAPADDASRRPTVALPPGASAADAAAAEAAAAAADTAGLPAVPGYEVLAKLGAGGMGVVYKARQTSLGRTVALKVLPHADHSTATSRARFRAEAEAVARLAHPNIVQIFEVGEHAGLPYFSLEFCPGGSLADKLDGTPWAAKEAARLVEALARAVEAAHRARVVHRDLKPANVLLAADGTPKVSDFGLAKKLDERGQTQTGAIMGTPSYMAPEQARGDKDVGPAADVYALGVILYELLTGRPPFKAPTMWDTVRQVLTEEPVSVRRLQAKVPRDLETVCHKCLEKDPRKRYGSAELLAEDLRRFQAGEPVQARPVGRPERAVRWARRHPAAAALLATIGLIALAVPPALLVHTMQLHEALDRVRAEREHALTAEQEARRNEARARLSNFASDLHLASNLFRAGDVFQLPALLEPYRRAEGTADDDPRGFAWWYLARQAQAPRPTLQAHDGPLRLLRYSPDGGSLITCGGRDGRQVVKVWDRASGRPRFSRPLHDSYLSLAAYAPGGTLLAGTTERAVVTLWDAGSGEQRRRMPQMGDAYHVALSPDGRRLAVLGVPCVSVWDCTTGRPESTLPLPDAPSHLAHVGRLAFAPDGKSLVAATKGASFVGLRWWDPVSGRPEGQVNTPREVSFLAFSPRGTFLLMVAGDGAVWHAALRVPLYWSSQIGPCSSLAVSPDERALAVGTPDGQVHLRDVATGRLRGRYRWQGNPIVQVAFSPDGRRLAAATAEGQVREMDAAVEHSPGGLQTFTPIGTSPCWSPDGQTLAVSTHGDGVRLLDRRSGEQRLALRCPASDVRCLAFAPDGRTLATACFGERAVRLWDTTDGRLRAVTAPEGAEASALAFAPDGRRLAAAVGGRVRFWDAATGAAQDHFDTGQPVQDLAFSPDGRALLTAGATLQAWYVGDATPRAPAGTGRAASPALRLAVARDGKRAATGHADGTVHLWQLAADGGLAADGAELPITRDGGVTSLGFGREDRTLLVAGPGAAKVCDLSTRGRRQDFLTGALTGAALAPDGRTLAVVQDGGAVQFWELPGWRVRQPRGQRAGRIDSLVFSADGRTLVTAGRVRPITVQNRGLITAETEPLRSTAETLRFWDAATGEEAAPPVPARETMAAPRVVARSPDGRLLAAGAEDGSVWVWDWPKGRWLTRLFVSDKARVYAETAELARRTWTNSRPRYDNNGEAVRALAFAPDGSGLAASGSRGSVRVWETDGWKERGQWAAAADGSPWVAFTPDGEGVAGGRGGQVCVWDARTGQVRAVLGEEGGPGALCGAFAPGGGVLAVGGRDGSIRLWDPAGGGERRLPGGHQDRVTSLAFSPDGRTLASGGWDHTVRLWSLRAGREVAALEGDRGRVHAVAFSPDGLVLTAGCEAGVMFWRR